MSGIQTQQTREMRVDPQPTCRKDAQHMRVRDEQHGMAALHQRHRLIDGLLHTVIGLSSNDGAEYETFPPDTDTTEPLTR